MISESSSNIPVDPQGIGRQSHAKAGADDVRIHSPGAKKADFGTAKTSHAERRKEERAKRKDRAGRAKAATKNMLLGEGNQALQTIKGQQPKITQGKQGSTADNRNIIDIIAAQRTKAISSMLRLQWCIWH